MKGLKLATTLFAVGLFLAAPSIPNSTLEATVGNPIGVVVLLVATLAAARVDLVLSLAVFLAAGALFLENRKRILAKLAGTARTVAASSSAGPLLNSVENVSIPATPLVDGEVHPIHEAPFTEEHSFEPSSGSGSNAFSPVSNSINAKTALATGTPISANLSAQGFVKAGLV